MADLTPQHYEAKQPWWLISPQEQLNKQLEEQRRIIIKWMEDDLMSGWKYDQIKWDLKYEVVWNIWVVIYKWEANSWYKYWKNTWVEYYTNLKWTFTNEDLDYSSRDSWYQVKNWKLFRNWQEIPQFLWKWKVNPEFVKWVDNLNFYQDIQLMYWSIKTIESKRKIDKVDVKAIYNSIITWVARIKDIMYFAWKWYIQNDDIPRLLKRAIQELPNQCSDTRFYQTSQWIRMWMEVTKDELDQYLKPAEWKPLITQSMYNDCLKRIEARDRKINEINWVKEESKSQREVEKTRNWFVDRVKWILGY